MCHDELAIKIEIAKLKQRLPTIKNKQTRLQQQKYMHRLQKELQIYNFYTRNTKY